MSRQVDRPMTHLLPAQRIATARAVALDRMPYFSSGVLDLVPREAPGLGSLAVTDRGILLFDPEVLGQWTPAEGGAVYLHEYLHIFLKHSERFERLVRSGVLTTSAQDRQLWNECCDAEINDDLQEAGLSLPSITIPSGEELKPILPELRGWPKHGLAEEYLKIELDKRPPPEAGGGSGDEEEDDGATPPAVGAGHCGSGAGNPVPDEPPADDPDARSADDLDQSRRAGAQSMVEHAKSRGSVPRGLLRQAADMLAPARVAWQTLLGRRVRSAVAHRAGQGDYTRLRPSRRQAAFMDWPGEEPRLLATCRPQVEVAVVMDTSGSIDDEQAALILSEVQGVLSALGGARVTFLSADAAVSGRVRTHSLRTIKEHVRGGGGTDFRPALAELATETRPRPSVVVYATDGYGPAPEEPPRGMDVIWLLTPDGRPPCDWGQVVEMDSGAS